MREGEREGQREGEGGGRGHRENKVVLLILRNISATMFSLLLNHTHSLSMQNVDL